MSTSAYSLDLRKRVINHIESGHSQRSAAVMFRISSSAANRWWKEYKTTGKFVAKPRKGSTGKVNKESLVSFMQSNPNITLLEVGRKFNVSAAAICKLLKGLGFSYKKNVQLCGS